MWPPLRRFYFGFPYDYETLNGQVRGVGCYASPCKIYSYLLYICWLSAIERKQLIHKPRLRISDFLREIDSARNSLQRKTEWSPLQ